MNRKAFAATLLFLLIFCSSVYAVQENMDNPFGVLEFLHWNDEWNNYKYSSQHDLERAVSLMKEAGVGWVRMDFVWDNIEPAQGSFNFTKYDAIVGLVGKNNINILGILDYSAGWASSCGEWNCPPKDNSLFVNYIVKVIGRYKDRVKYWEIWNEPDSRTYWSEQDGLKIYCLLLKDAYMAAKMVDPDCKILNGGFANGNSSVNHIYDNGARDYFDIMNIHLFESPFSPGADKRLAAIPKLTRKIMSRNGDGQKPIWITEVGCPGVKRGTKVDIWWIGRNPNERQQGKWLEKVYSALIGRNNVEKVFWAFFRDCRYFWDNGTDYFGIVRWDFSKKPAFSAYQRCVNKWRGSK